MHHASVDLVEDHGLAVPPVVHLLVGQARVQDQAEGQEQGVLSEEVDKEDSMDMPVSKLIDCQVENRDSLDHEKTLDLAPSLLELVVVGDSNHHVNGHESYLEQDPSLLGPISERVLVGIVIEILWIS